MQFDESWDCHLPLAKFAYNNSFHTSLNMLHFEALYGKACWTPLCWNEFGERAILGLELVDEATENIQVFKKNLKTDQDRQKSIPDGHARHQEYNVGDRVFLRLSP